MERLDLEKQCGRCGGLGFARGDDGLEPCPECRGNRVVPTRLGEQVLEFLGRHLGAAGGGIVRRRGA